MGDVAFEADLVVRQKNPLVNAAAIALVVAGVAGLAAFAMKVGGNPGGALTVGIEAPLIAFLLWRMNRRDNLAPRKSERRVRVSADGVEIGGQIVVPRAAIVEGFYQPRGASGSVRLVDKAQAIVFEADVADERQGLEVLHALGLDAAARRAAFKGPSPLLATAVGLLTPVLGSLAFLGLTVKALSTAGLAGGSLFITSLLPLVVLLSVFLSSTKIEVGADGILTRWLGRERFIPMADVVSVEARSPTTIEIRLASGGQALIHTGTPSLSPSLQTWNEERRDAVLARMKEALSVHRSRGQVADVSALVSRGARAHEEWIGALRALRGGEGGYRDAVVREEDLWGLVEDPSAAEDARAAAALVLRGSLDDAGKTRVRVAAEASASPKLRIALDAAASEPEDAAVEEALEALAVAESKAARPA